MARTSRLQPNTLFAGDFRVKELLAKGSMGTVYLAEQTSLAAPRALKVMSAELLGDRRFVVAIAAAIVLAAVVARGCFVR